MLGSHGTIRLLRFDSILRRLIAAAVFVAATFALQMLPAAAQGNPPQPQRPAQQQAAEPEEMEIEQIELTQSQIDAFIATQKEIAPITAKLKGKAQPTKQMTSQMESIAKKNGFRDFDEFGDVGTNIGVVFDAINPESKRYDPEGMIRRQIGVVHGDTKIPPKQKLQILRDLQQALTSVPKLKHPANAELVARNYDRLRPVMGQ